MPQFQRTPSHTVAKTIPLNYNTATSLSIQTASVPSNNNVVAQHSHNINHNISLTQPNNLNNTPNINSNTENSREVENEENKSAEYPEFNEYFGPPSSYFSTNNKYEKVANPFADPDFDFDKFLTNVSNGQFKQMREKSKPKPKQRLIESSLQPPRLILSSEPKLRTQITQAIQQKLTPPPEPQPKVKIIQSPKYTIPFKSKFKPMIVQAIRQTTSVTPENYITPKYITKTYPYTPESQIVSKLPPLKNYALTTLKPLHSKYYVPIESNLPSRHVEHKPKINSLAKTTSKPKFIPLTPNEQTSTVPPSQNEYYYYDDNDEDKEIEKEKETVTHPTTISPTKKIYSSRIKPEPKPNEDYYYEYYDYPEEQETKSSNVNKSGEIKYSAKYQGKPAKISKTTRRPIATTLYTTTQKIFSSESLVKYYTTQKPRNELSLATTKPSRSRNGQRLTDSDTKQR